MTPFWEGQWERWWKGWRLERRPDPSAGAVWLVSSGAVLAALVVTGFIFMAYGHNPFTAYGVIVEGTLTDARGLAEVVRKAIPLLLCGVGLVLAFRARFYNIGAEGQILAGAVAASGVALFAPVPAPLMLLAMFGAGFLAGGLWGVVPALLKVKLGVNEIITTLMMNYIAFYITQYLIYGPWRGASARGFPYSERFASIARLPLLPGTRLHWPTLLLGLALALFVAFSLARSTLGFEIRMLGESPEAARYAGVNVMRTTLLLVLVAAGAAGLAGVGEVAGIHTRLVSPGEISLGYGYTAIIVALLARGNPLAAVVGALFLGFVFAAGDVARVALRIPVQLTDVISGLVLFFLICSEPLMRLTLRRTAADPTPETARPSGGTKPASPEGVVMEE